MSQPQRDNSKPRIATLNDFRNTPSANDKQQKGQNFYTGGGSSGLEVEGPKKTSNNPNEIVSNLFESARKFVFDLIIFLIIFFNYFLFFVNLNLFFYCLNLISKVNHLFYQK